MKLLWIGCTLLLLAIPPAFGDGATKPAGVTAAQPTLSESGYIQWLEERSMLHQAQAVARRFAGSSAQWHTGSRTDKSDVLRSRAAIARRWAQLSHGSRRSRCDCRSW